MRAHDLAALIVLSTACLAGLVGCPSSSSHAAPDAEPEPKVFVTLVDGAAPIEASCQNLCDKALKCRDRSDPEAIAACAKKCEAAGRNRAQLRARMLQMECTELNEWLAR